MKPMKLVDNFAVDSTTLTYKICPECGGKAEEIINVEYHIRQGWYCVPCSAFQSALFRERLIDDDANNMAVVNHKLSERTFDDE